MPFFHVKKLVDSARTWLCSYQIPPVPYLARRVLQGNNPNLLAGDPNRERDLGNIEVFVGLNGQSPITLNAGFDAQGRRIGFLTDRLQCDDFFRRVDGG